jgi:hypothetical protein
MVLNDERAGVPIGSYQKRFGVTLSLLSIVGRRGAIMSDEQREGLRKSADALGTALDRVRKQPRAGGGFQLSHLSTPDCTLAPLVLRLRFEIR